MEFNIKKFLVEHKLGMYSKAGANPVKEDDNTGLVMPTGDEEEYGDEEDMEDDWNKPDYDDAADSYEEEPAATDVKPDASALGLHKKQIELQSLEDKKDSLLMQLKSNIITLDQYKEQIGNIPAQIKKLRADIDQAMNVSMDDYGEEAN